MPDLWGLVLDSSDLPDAPENDLWNHLNNLGSGSGIGLGVVLLDGLDIEMEDRCVDIELELSSVDVMIDTEEIEVDIETVEFDIEVC